jgi:hypothetical protein
MSQIATQSLPVPAPFNPNFAARAFLPRIELYTAAKKPVKAGKFPANHWAFIPAKDQLVDLGETPLIYPLAYKYQAVDFSGAKIRICEDEKSAEFAEMMRRADDPNRPKGEQAPCAYGLNFLVVVKDHGFATYHASSYSAKLIVPSFYASIYSFVQLGSYFKESDKHSWQAPSIAKTQSTFDLPSQEKILEAITAFNAVRPGVAEQEPDMEGDVTVTPERPV